MNEQNLEKTSADLSHAERFGTTAVRETGQNAIEQWKQNWEMLAGLSSLFLEKWEEACLKEDEQLEGAYSFLDEYLQDYAREHLSPPDYHFFIEATENRYSHLFRHMD